MNADDRRLIWRFFGIANNLGLEADELIAAGKTQISRQGEYRHLATKIRRVADDLDAIATSLSMLFSPKPQQKSRSNVGPRRVTPSKVHRRKGEE
jgi:hypothetical protein